MYNPCLSRLIPALLVIISLSCNKSRDSFSGDQSSAWPAITETMKPWTRWWWMGNAVDKENISRRLEEFAEAGIGGVEITPIYGTKGYEDRFLQHLSEEWMEMLVHTLDEAERLGLGVDMILGTGWPYGGPQVEPEYAAGKLYIQRFKLKEGEQIIQKIQLTENEQPDLAEVQFLYAIYDGGEKSDLTGQLVGDKIDWTADKDCMLFAIISGRTGQRVKRAAPGGEGFVLDHFSKKALEDYLHPYSDSLGPVRDKLRAVFNDSYEVYEANYTPELLDEFHSRRGYDLSDHLPTLYSGTPSEDLTRIMNDYRLTLSDLLLENFSLNWTGWANDHSFKSRYQAHGSPGNLIDLYASADIPECESFYATKFDIPGFRWEASDANMAEPDHIMFKFASSAAHIAGKPLVSSETFTWLREHFKTALSQCKPEVEQLFLAGVNHTFFHGSTYSPDEAEWPGWKFYASVNFASNYTIWKDAPSMFAYLARCQSLLQSGQPDNELLVYWPFYDVLDVDNEGELLLQLGIHNKDEWLVPTPFYQLVSDLINKGYSIDFINDSYLAKARERNGDIQVPGGRYKALIVPDCKNMPLPTFGYLTRLHEEGANVFFTGLPESVPGYHNYIEQTSKLLEMIAEEKGNLAITDIIPQVLTNMGIKREELVDVGLAFIRRKMRDGKVYCLVNHTPHNIDGYVTIGTHAKSVLIMDPLTGGTGEARIIPREEQTEVYLQVKPGESYFLRTYDDEKTDAPAWEYYAESGNPSELNGPWDVSFMSGGPRIPDDIKMPELKSWTAYGADAKAFSGTSKYNIQFENPDPHVTAWLLQLGDVRESARVWVNGEYKGCLWSNPFEKRIGRLQEGTNTLEIEVTNLSANRLRDLERGGREWKIFYDINMVNRHYSTFDATGWKPMPSGLLGKVRIVPLELKSY
jgi:hypothetical protein